MNSPSEYQGMCVLVGPRRADCNIGKEENGEGS